MANLKPVTASGYRKHRHLRECVQLEIQQFVRETGNAEIGKERRMNGRGKRKRG